MRPGPEPSLTPPSTARADWLNDRITDALSQLDREVKRLHAAWDKSDLGAMQYASDALEDIAQDIWGWTMELEDDAFDQP